MEVTSGSASAGPSRGAVFVMLKWDFRVRAEKVPDSRYFRVSIEGMHTGVRYERTGLFPLWELIRLIGALPLGGEKQKGD